MGYSGTNLSSGLDFQGQGGFGTDDGNNAVSCYLAGNDPARREGLTGSSGLSAIGSGDGAGIADRTDAGGKCPAIPAPALGLRRGSDHILLCFYRFCFQCLVEMNEAGDDHQDNSYRQDCSGDDLNAEHQTLLL